MEHAHLLYGDMVLQMSHTLHQVGAKILCPNLTPMHSLSSPTYERRAKNGSMMNFTFQPLLHKASTKTLFWCGANWRRKSSQTSNNCRYPFLHTWVESSLVDATNELATSEQENRIVTHSIPQRPHYYHQRRMVTIHTLTNACQCDLGDGDTFHLQIFNTHFKPRKNSPNTKG
jgi:hypothetical protein